MSYTFPNIYSGIILRCRQPFNASAGLDEALLLIGKKRRRWVRQSTNPLSLTCVYYRVLARHPVLDRVMYLFVHALSGLDQMLGKHTFFCPKSGFLSLDRFLLGERRPDTSR